MFKVSIYFIRKGLSAVTGMEVIVQAAEEKQVLSYYAWRYFCNFHRTQQEANIHAWMWFTSPVLIWCEEYVSPVKMQKDLLILMRKICCMRNVTQFLKKKLKNFPTDIKECTSYWSEKQINLKTTNSLGVHTFTPTDGYTEAERVNSLTWSVQVWTCASRW